MIRDLAELEAMREPVFVVDVATERIVHANPAAVALTGRTLAELQSLHHTMVLAPENVDTSQSDFLTAPQVMDSVRRTVLHSDGYPIAVEVTSNHFTEPDGKRMLMAICRDITEQKAGSDSLNHIE